jgi:uncharacterized repeat protein (TIGR03803 family)
VNGTLYGTTSGGGANTYYGTAFSITKSGTETVLHSFGGSRDGAAPWGLINVKGVLYGTTEFGGGANSGGTVFSITTSGTETVLYSFKGGPGDGEWPYAGLLEVNGTFYGTTSYGGANYFGTVFKLSQAH